MLNRGFDQGTTFLWGNIREFLDSLSFGREGFVFNRGAKPLRIITPAQVIEPRFIIDPVGNLPKEDKILGPKIQSFLRTAKIKTSVRPEFPFRVLTAVAAAVGMTRGRA
jgi:hypothetical protein